MDEEIHIAGEWLREDILGRSNICITTLWRDTTATTSDKIVIKNIRTQLQQQQQYKISWNNALQTMTTISHENIAKIVPIPQSLVDAFQTKLLTPLCTEYFYGKNLRTELNMAEHCIGLRESDVRKILKDVGAAVEYLHSLGIVHGRLKPENIVASHPPDYCFESLRYKLTDVGLVGGIKTDDSLIRYSAPEALRGHATVSIDYWSLGVLAAELVNGIVPFPFDSLTTSTMELLKSKTPRQICGELSLNGNLVYRETLFDESRCSEPFRLALTEWLRSVLDVDPERRGRKSVGGDIIVFSDLACVLNSMVLSIFWLNGRTLLSYRVDRFTRWNTVCDWIERDTSIAKNRLVFIGGTGKILPDGSASESESLAVMVKEPIYLISVDRVEDMTPEKFPSMGTLLRRCMEKPKTELKGSDVRMISRQLFHLVNTQIDIEKRSVLARVARLAYVKSNIDLLHAARVECDKHFSVSEEIHSFILSTINADEQRMKNCRVDEGFTNKYGLWLKSAKKILGETRKLKEARDVFDTRLNSARRRIEEITGFLRQTESEEFYQKVCTTVLAARRLNKTKAAVRETRQVVQLAYECLKRRENTLMDGDVHRSSVACVGLCQENSKMHTVITQLAAEAQRLIGDMKKAAEDRDALLWSTIISSPSSVSFKIGGPVRQEKKLQSFGYALPDLSSLLTDSASLRENTHRMIKDFQTKQETICKDIDENFQLG